MFKSKLILKYKFDLNVKNRSSYVFQKCSKNISGKLSDSRIGPDVFPTANCCCWWVMPSALWSSPIGVVGGAPDGGRRPRGNCCWEFGFKDPTEVSEGAGGRLALKAFDEYARFLHSNYSLSPLLRPTRFLVWVVAGLAGRTELFASNCNPLLQCVRRTIKRLRKLLLSLGMVIE